MIAHLLIWLFFVWRHEIDWGPSFQSFWEGSCYQWSVNNRRVTCGWMINWIVCFQVFGILFWSPWRFRCYDKKSRSSVGSTGNHIKARIIVRPWPTHSLNFSWWWCCWADGPQKDSFAFKKEKAHLRTAMIFGNKMENVLRIVCFYPL